MGPLNMLTNIPIQTAELLILNGSAVAVFGGSAWESVLFWCTGTNV